MDDFKDGIRHNSKFFDYMWTNNSPFCRNFFIDTTKNLNKEKVFPTIVPKDTYVTAKYYLRIIINPSKIFS